MLDIHKPGYAEYLNLPDSDDEPVDHEIQNLLPNLLLSILAWLWSDRADWTWNVDMGIFYYRNGQLQPALCPDGFLSVGVPRQRGEQLRLSYAMWMEDEIPPIFVLEIVSKTKGGEYDQKLLRYADLGVLYYCIYNPDHYQRDRHDPFEIYKLIDGVYQRQSGEPFWMSELELGIGRQVGSFQFIDREWLYWFNEAGDRYLTPEERSALFQAQAKTLAAETQTLEEQAQTAKQRADRLAAKLRELGLNPDDL